MKILENLDCEKGITLNSQLVDLLSIIDEPISTEEQNEKIIEYLEELEKRQSGYMDASKLGTSHRYRFLIESILAEKDNITAAQKSELADLYLSNLDNVYDSSAMESLLQENGFDVSINQQVLKDLRNVDYTAKSGVLELNPEKVRAFHSHLFDGSKNTYDRVTFDNAGKYSSYVAIDGKTYANERLEKMLNFCDKHNMKSKINTFIMYSDFPKLLENHLQAKVDKGEITEEEKKQEIKESLKSYVEDIATKYGSRIDTVDMFNELIYDPQMSEEGFAEEATYHERTEGWQKYLDIKDLCEIALTARKSMPNTTFTYNDMNWTDKKKRKEIIKVVKEIKKIESEYIEQGLLEENETLIDTIGFEAHLTTSVKLKDIESVFRDVTKRLKMPIEITELDCARTGQNPESKEEVNKQKNVFHKVFEMSKKYGVKAFTIWSQSDELSFMNKKCRRNVHASLLDSNFNEKDIYQVKEKSLFEKFKERFSKKDAKVPELPEPESAEKNWSNDFRANIGNEVWPPENITEKDMKNMEKFEDKNINKMDKVKDDSQII